MKTILLIEDNEGDQFLGREVILSVRPDIEIIKAMDGQEALEILEEMPEMPDLILLDINMPRMNGHEFLEAFSKKNVPKISAVIMLTSSEQERDREQALSYKFVKDYILKPLEPEHVKKLEEIADCD